MASTISSSVGKRRGTLCATTTPSTETSKTLPGTLTTSASSFSSALTVAATRAARALTFQFPPKAMTTRAMGAPAMSPAALVAHATAPNKAGASPRQRHLALLHRRLCELRRGDPRRRAWRCPDGRGARGTSNAERPRRIKRGAAAHCCSGTPRLHRPPLGHAEETATSAPTAGLHAKAPARRRGAHRTRARDSPALQHPSAPPPSLRVAPRRSLTTRSTSS